MQQVESVASGSGLSRARTKPPPPLPLNAGVRRTPRACLWEKVSTACLRAGSCLSVASELTREARSSWSHRSDVSHGCHDPCAGSRNTAQRDHHRLRSTWLSNRGVSERGAGRGVRARSVFGTVGAGLETLFGGNTSLLRELAERTRQQAFDTMFHQADLAGADAVIGRSL